MKENIGGYNLNQVIVLWGLAASSYGVAHIVFKKAFEISDLIINGKLDSFIVQPKNIFLSVITSDTTVSAIGDWIYGYICLFIYGISIKNFLLYTLFLITGGIIVSAFSSILGSLSFWIVRGDIISDSLTNMMLNFATYPGTIFKDGVRILFYTVIPLGISNYIPVDTIIKFNIISTGI